MAGGAGRVRRRGLAAQSARIGGVEVQEGGTRGDLHLAPGGKRCLRLDKECAPGWEGAALEHVRGEEPTGEERGTPHLRGSLTEACRIGATQQTAGGGGLWGGAPGVDARE